MDKYSEILLDHFNNPRNVGEIRNADGVGGVGDEECGDYVRIWIKVKDEHISDIRFKCRGCPAAIGTTSIFCEMVRGMHIDEAFEMTEEMVEEASGGLPEAKQHCSNLGPGALYSAIMNYIMREAEKSSGDARRENEQGPNKHADRKGTTNAG